MFVCQELKELKFYSLFQPISNVFRGGSIVLIVMQEFPLPFWEKNKIINHKLAEKIQKQHK